MSLVLSLMIPGMAAANEGVALAPPEDSPGKPGVGPAAPIAEPVPGGFESWDELMAMQDRLGAAAERIQAAKAPGYAGIVAKPENRELHLYWKGDVPSPVVKLIEQLRGTVPIRVLPARYSEAEMTAEAQRLIEDAQVTAVGPTADGSGLSVSVSGTVIEAQQGAAMGVTTMAMTIEEHFKPSLSTRWDDRDPWWGGAVWQTTRQRCTTGFAVTLSFTTAILSAGHCAANGETATDPSGQVIGAVFADNNDRDTLLITAVRQSAIYTGGVGAVGGVESYRSVTGSAASFEGNIVCTSGAYSGERCGILVHRINQLVDFPGQRIGPLVLAERADHTAAQGNGDSGGPVFSPAGTGATARGTITGQDLSTEVPCTGIPTGGSIFARDRHCAWRFWYVDVVPALALYGATIP